MMETHCIVFLSVVTGQLAKAEYAILFAQSCPAGRRSRLFAVWQNRKAGQKRLGWRVYGCSGGTRAEGVQANCAGCHQADLGGKGEVPALKGDGFMERWHDYSVRPLFNLIRDGDASSAFSNS